MVGKKPDYVLVIVVGILLILGVLILTSISVPLSQAKFGNPYYFLKHQIFWGLIPGLILGFLAFKIRLDSLKKWAPLLLLINLILMAMVFLPKIGLKLGGASRWLSFGGMTFQPSEFLKLTFLLYLSCWLAARMSPKKFSKRQTEKNFSQTLFAFLIMVGLVGGLLICQSDASTLGIIIITGVLIYFLAGTPFWHIILIILLGTAGFYSAIKFVPYRMKRWTVFLNPEIDPLGIGYQLKQALIAVGSGGIFGLGLGMSRQKFGFLPHAISDSVFAIFSEETGFLGAAILIFLFLLFFWRGFKISKKTEDKFSKLTALGISLWIILQTFVNMGAMIGVLPLSGIPLPFISYGGSHLVAEMIGVGILLNISQSSKHLNI
jgi:cell division protein FtsW